MTDVAQLARWLAGTFENADQARAQPTWFVHLRWWHQPVSESLTGFPALFAEQSPAINLERAYRQRIVSLQTDASGPTIAQYYALKQPERWRGGGRDRALLAALTPEDLEFLPGCHLDVTFTATDTPTFQARSPQGTRCQFIAGDALCEVQLGFDVTAQEYRSYDKGIDPDTGKPIWGALLGPYRLQRQPSS